MKKYRILWFICLLMSWQISAHSLTLTASLPPFPPYYYADVEDSSVCRGVGVKILELLSRQTGVSFEMVNYPYARILKVLQSGQLDVALIFKNRMLRDDVYYIGPVATSQVLVVRRGANQPQSYDELKALRGIAVIRKAQFQAKFDRDNTLKKTYVESYQQGLKMLKIGRVEAIIGSELGLSYAMKQLAMDPSILQQAFHIGDKEWWLHLAKKNIHRSLIPRLQQGVDRLYKFNLSVEVYRQQLEKGCYQ